MAELVLIAMVVVVILYAVLGGADFGLGMVEPWLGAEGRERVDRALLPVWEVNHVWLVLLVVLGFVAFPAAFSLVAIHLHIPLLLVLLGIVARGSAFTFRHYDPHAGALDRWYTWAFRLGSALTPLFLGVIAAAGVEGRLPEQPGQDFYASFIGPWNTPFCWITGAFCCALFAFQGAALLAAELGAPVGEPLPYLRLARRLHAASVALGALVLALAYVSDAAGLRHVLRHPWSWACLAAATLLIPVIAYAFAHGRAWWLRLSSGAQLACVLIGLWGPNYPALLFHRAGALTVAQAAAPPATLRTLLIALVIGLALIVPSLVYLLRVYKAPGAEPVR
ncbi:MAG TPA: cytochrome d ubiquinol oxidase subunit II [Polyangiales bacterium]